MREQGNSLQTEVNKVSTTTLPKVAQVRLVSREVVPGSETTTLERIFRHGRDVIGGRLAGYAGRRVVPHTVLVDGAPTNFAPYGGSITSGGNIVLIFRAAAPDADDTGTSTHFLALRGQPTAGAGTDVAVMGVFVAEEDLLPEAALAAILAHCA